MAVASTMPARFEVRGLRALENFRFFEFHLPLKERIKRLAHKADPEDLKMELEKLDKFSLKRRVVSDSASYRCVRLPQLGLGFGFADP
jgi:hypothetical protein